MGRIDEFKSKIKAFEDTQGKFLESVDKSIYHYCSLDTLWKILEGNSFLATHVEFSNDSEEYTIGKNLFAEYLENKIGHEINNAQEVKEYINNWKERPTNECFMICFCEDDNILSQWREYARNGVSIELDFNYLSFYEISKLKDEEDKSNNTIIINEPKKVIYVNKHNGNGKMQQFDDLDNKLESSLSFVPYIKHIGFCEEKEVRFIFENINGIFSDKIDFVDRKGMKVPVIKVKHYQGDESEIKVYTNFDLKNRMAEAGISDPAFKIIDIESEQITYDDSVAALCLKNRLNNAQQNNQQDMKKSIYITNYYNKDNNQQESICYDQKQVYEQVCSILITCGLNDVDIQCEGFLPIKSIMVGPGKRQQEIKRGVEEYLKQFYYWSRVEVKTSDIPYRSEKSDLITS